MENSGGNSYLLTLIVFKLFFSNFLNAEIISECFLRGQVGNSVVTVLNSL